MRNVTLMFHNVPTALCQNPQSRKTSPRAGVSLNYKLFPHAISTWNVFPFITALPVETESVRNWETWSRSSSSARSSQLPLLEQAACVFPTAFQ